MSDWGTPTPDLTMVHNACRAMEHEGLDVHTITVMLNGQHGGWDVSILATNEDLEDVERQYILERYGSIEEKEKA